MIALRLMQAYVLRMVGDTRLYRRTVLMLSGLCLIVLAACSTGDPAPQTRLVAVGDSILTWNSTSGRDIPQIVSQGTGLPVFNAAVSGARFLGPNGIPAQYPTGDWEWLIVDGGGNDLGSVCGDPTGERAVLDRLIADDLDGAYATFLRRVTAGGTKVILMGYAPVSIQGGPFAPCVGALEELRARQARLAASMPDVTFADVQQVVRPDNTAAYTFDRVHPTPLGGRLMADLIASEIGTLRNR